MWVHVLAIVGLGALCAGWFYVQRWTQAARANDGDTDCEGCGWGCHRH